MSKIREQAAELLKQKRQKEAIPLLRRLMSYTERRVRDGSEIRLDAWPYSALATVFRQRGDFDREREVLERYLNKAGESVHDRFAQDAKMRLERARLFGDKGKGPCEDCHQLRTLQCEGGKWFCSKCLPRRKLFARVRDLGLRMSSEATEEQARKVLDLHCDAARYVGDVWFALTGRSYKRGEVKTEKAGGGGIEVQTTVWNELPDFNRFVSRFFQDPAIVRRWASKERARTEFAEQRLTAAERVDPFKYQHIVRRKPKLDRDDDFRQVEDSLRQQYGDQMPPPKRRWSLRRKQ